MRQIYRLRMCGSALIISRSISTRLIACCIAIVLGLSGVFNIASTQASSEELVPILISFYELPGNAEQSQVISLGGSVNKTYHIVPVVSAFFPRSKINQLYRNPRIKLVEEDITVSITGQQVPWGVDRIDADLVHPTNKGAGVKIAVLDTGIDLDHPDLSVAGGTSTVYSSMDDDNGHGTLVAGIIAALDNDIGVVGVAPEASIYSVKVLNEYGSGAMSVILAGIEWAVDNNMDVINMSIGGAMSWPSTVVDALSYAYNNGILIVAGAGNGGNPDGTGDNIWAPARYDSVVAVGAIDSGDNRYSSSSTGSTLELMAPGVNIYSTAMGGDYGYISCTSAASPFAAGVAALIKANGVYGSTAIRNVMKESVDDLGNAGWDSQYGWGLVDAYQAINYSFSDSTAPATTFSLSGTGNGTFFNSDVQVTLAAIDNDGGAGVAGTRYSLDNGDTWQLYTVPFVINTVGVTDILAESWDAAGNLESPAVSQTVIIDNIAPVTTFSLSGAGSGTFFNSDVQVTLAAIDNDGGAGVAGTRYSLDNGDTWQLYTVPFVINIVGVTDILAASWDAAGNLESPAVSQTVIIDKTAPVTTVYLSGTSGNDGWYLSNVQVTLSAADNQNGSGISLVEYSFNNGQTWNNYTTPFSVSTEGVNQVLSRATDAAGNVELPISSEIKIDKTAPVLVENLNPQQIQRLGKNKWVDVSYTGIVQDSISGVYFPTDTMLIDEYGQLSRNLGSNPTGIVAVEAWCDGGDANGRTYTFRLTASDNAGNQNYIDAITVVVK